MARRNPVKVITWLAFILVSLPTFGIEYQLRFEQISMAQGLSNKRVQCIVEDKSGFIWIGTQFGLNKYDGNNFKVFKSDPTTKNSLVDNNITTLLVDKSGSLWIGTKRGLNRLDTRTNRFNIISLFEKQNIGIYDNEIIELTIDQKNNIWVLSKNGISCIDPKTLACENFAFSEKKTSQDQKFYSVIYKNSKLWLGAESGLFYFDLQTKNFIKESVEFPAILKISENQDSTFVFAHSKGYSTFNFISKKRHNPIANIEYPVASLLKTKFSGFWIASSESSIYQHIDQKLVHHNANFSNPESLKTRFITTLFEDKSDILWIGSADQGLFKMDPKAQFFKTKRIQNEKQELIQNPNVKAIAEDKNQTIWIGSEKGLYSASKGENIYRTWFYNQKPLTDVKSILCLKGAVLVGSVNGLFQIKNNQVLRIELEIASKQFEVSSLAADQIGNVWIGTKNSGVCIWNQKENTFAWLFSGKISSSWIGNLLSNTIKKILCDKLGRIWIGTDRGLNLIESEFHKITSFINESGNSLSLPPGPILPMLVDNRQNLWLATSGGGICKLPNGSQDFTIYNEFNGLSSAFISAIVQEKENNLWISTEKGINELNTETLLITKYSLGDGLLFEEFNENSFWKFSNGQISFGCLEGMVNFSPGEIVKQYKRPRVFFTDLQILNKRIELKIPLSDLKEIALTHKQNYFTITYSVINFHLPTKIKVYYRLLGLESEWIDAGRKREISYSNLDYKSYQFQLKAENDEGIESKILSIPIIIIPPYWRTDGFKILSILSFLVLIFVLYRSRISIVAKRNKRLEKLVERRTAELQQINGRIELQAQEILREKLKLEDTNRKLWSNIEYGNKIQRATLPEMAEIQEFLPEFFVVYLPKDIVSGDFYWFTERKNKLLMAAVDCTGHGVPGAFMSLIGYEKLNKIVAEEGIESPAIILDSLEQKLQSLLKQNDLEAGSTDGMEVALVALEKNFSSLTFSGAHRPLYLVRNNELIEFKGNNFGVGGGLSGMKKGNFNEIKIPLASGDMVYLFSDGFVGQFDSETGKKYFTKNFRELLKTVSGFTAEKQQLLIQHELRSFAKKSPQIDDILIMGFRVP